MTKVKKFEDVMRGKDYERFLTIARGSVIESEDWFLKLRDLELISSSLKT